MSHKNIYEYLNFCLLVVKLNRIQKKNDFGNLEYEKFFYYDQYSKKIHFNMRNLIDFQLKEVLSCKIYHVKKDTYSEDSIFFSHRRALHTNLSPTGRMINIIGFKQKTHN